MATEPKPPMSTSFVKSFFNEIFFGPGAKNLVKVLISPAGLLGTFFLLIAFFIGLVNNPRANTLKVLFWYIFFFIALAESWNIIGGYAGEIDFGHVLFAGVGMYTMAILINTYHIFDWFKFLGNNVLFYVLLPLVLSVFLAGVSSAFVALLISFPVLKLRGAYFAIAMLAFAQMLANVFSTGNLIPFYPTNGGTGVNVGQMLGIIPDYTFVIYTSIIVVSIVAFVISHYFSYSRLGLSLRAIKGSPDGASSIGINVFFTKLQALVISGFIAGLAGSIYMLYLFDVTTETAFDTHTTVQMIIMTLLGGPASVFGPVLGAIIIWPIRSILNIALANVTLSFMGITLSFATAYLIVYGLIFVLAVLYIPDGIIGVLEKKGYIKRESLISQEDLDRYRNKGKESNE